MTVATFQPRQTFPVPAAAAATGVIAYVAGTFPLRSETFVYREVRGLRGRGWVVQAVSLHDPLEPGAPVFADLEAGVVRVYGEGRAATARAFLAEVLAHPLRSASTFAAAALDALTPGEPTSASSRAKLLFQAAAAIGLARRLRAGGVRHIHCHFAHAPATIGMYAAAQLGVPFSFTGHANDIFQRRSILKSKLRRAAFVSCISEWHRAFYESVLMRNASDYPVIRCGVDVAAWKPGGEEEVGSGQLAVGGAEERGEVASCELRVASVDGERPASSSANSSSFPTANRQLPTANVSFRILTVCRLVEKKGVDTLLRAVGRMQGRGTACVLTVAGDGPDRARLETLAKELGFGDSVQWLGAVDNERVPALLAGADVFALPCRADARGDRDGIPVVLMEAMACGVPAVAGDLPAIRELIEDGATGLLIDGAAADADERLAAGLVKLAADAALRRRLAAGGRTRVEAEFSLKASLDRLESRFQASL